MSNTIRKNRKTPNTRPMFSRKTNRHTVKSDMLLAIRKGTK